MSTISAIILIHSEGPLVRECLDSLTWVDERIVIDNGADSDTRSIAEKYATKIITTKITDFSKLRILGAESVTSDYILYIDADEVVTDNLRKEIFDTVRQVRTEQSPDAYEIVRKNIYLGRVWPYADFVTRLIYKSHLKSWFGDVHESVLVRGRVSQLHHHLIHKTHRSLEEMIQKTNIWSEVEARNRFQALHPPVVWWRFIRVMIPTFIEYYIKQGGWRVGTVGVIESIYQSYSMFLTYAKLWELQQKK